MKIKLLREYIKGILAESRIVDFAIDLGQNDAYKSGDRDYKLKDISSGREIKKLFNKHADHTFLSSLDTVHWISKWAGPQAIKNLIGKGRDELSATMSLPGTNFGVYPPGDFGLMINGRITLASNDMDELYTGAYYDYINADDEEQAKKKQQRKKSSGVNKLPQTRNDYKSFSDRKEMLKSKPELADNFVKSRVQFILDKDTWKPSGSTNEALVDNWKPIGIVSSNSGNSKIIETMFDKDISKSTGEIKTILMLAQELNVPVYNMDKSIIWISTK